MMRAIQAGFMRELGKCSVCGTQRVITKGTSSRNRLPGYPIAPLVLWAIMSSSCRSRSILEKLTMGLSTRKYRDAVREFRGAYGLEKERHQLALHRSQPGEMENR